MKKTLTALDRLSVIDALVNGDEGMEARNGDRSVWVECCAGGRYGLYLDDDYLTLTDDVHAALWYLKTGEWLTTSGRLFIDGKEAGK